MQDQPQFWQTMAEARSTSAKKLERTDEFPPDASIWSEGLNRRRFLEIMGASLALAGASGCGRPSKQIVPYVTAPEETIPGKPLYFATAMPWQGYARGILVESHLGRPTKIEGNPDHPESLGATDAVTQAAVLELYDPDRSRAPIHGNGAGSWQQFESAWLEQHHNFSANAGTGLALLTEPTTSPTLLGTIHRLLDTFPRARWYQHTSLPRFEGNGGPHDFDPAAADVIVAIGDDFLFSHPASVRYARAYASRRRIDDSARPLSRLYVVEPTPSVTGTMADHRLAAAPASIRRIVRALAEEMETTNWTVSETDNTLSDAAREFVRLAGRDLRDPTKKRVCLVGPEMDGDVRRAVESINSRLAVGGAQRPTPPRQPVRSDPDPRAAGMLGELTAALERGEVRALLILGSNPVHTAPADVAFADALARVEFTLHMGLYRDETAARCQWHLPESHFLESWSDLRSFGGTAGLLQPLVEPQFRTRTLAEVLDFCAHPPGKSDYELVRATWSGRYAGADFERTWNSWLRRGVIADGDVQAASGPASTTPTDLPRPTTPGEFGVILFRADSNVQDGRFSNNAWLQEIPRPLSHLVWDNAALVSPAFAQRHGLDNGDVVSLQSGERSLEAPVWIQPGQAEDCVTLQLGYGRTRAGRVGNGIGFNAGALRTAASPHEAPLTGLTRTGRRYELVSTQGHFSMEGRDIVRVVDVNAPGHAVSEAQRAAPRLFPEWKDPRYAWGMVIDLSTCIGCNACTVACQAENNIPVVGKEQVSRGREMHWIRVDRYFSGEPDDPRIVHQPVPCMQCETAPCELVCPVHATVHSNEGLNEMVYNRCIGTRYCSNNCPYKVRRFNFLDFQVPTESILTLQKNPDVTVRARGVMEKCTYCVQRINAARIEASKEQRLIRDGEVLTACQQACPTEAIVFGDLQTQGSQVATRRAHRLNYILLPDLNTRPRTSYLARVENPATPSERTPA